MKTLIGWGLSRLSAESIGEIVAALLTKALEKIKDKEKAAKISQAVAKTSHAGETCAKAVEDCVITPDEANAAAADIKDAVIAIVEAGR